MAKTTKKSAAKASGSDTTSDDKKKATKKKTTKKKAAAKKAVSKKKATAKKATSKKTAAKVYGAISSAERHQMISEAAYLRSEAQGFGGDGRQDWLDAEAEVDARLVKAKIKIVD